MIYGAKVNNVWRAYLDYYASSNETKYTVTGYVGMAITNDGYRTVRGFTGTISASSQSSYSGTLSKGTKRVGVGHWQTASHSYSWNKTTYAYNVTVASTLKGTDNSGTSSTSATFTVPALASYFVVYDANTGENPPSKQTKWHTINLTLTTQTPTKVGYSFVEWNTRADGSGTAYQSGDVYSANAGVTLYAIWLEDAPPLCEPDAIEKGRKIKNFTEVKTVIRNPRLQDETRTLESVEFIVGEQSTVIYEDFENAEMSIVPTSSGTLNAKVIITDSLPATSTYDLGNIVVENPQWKRTVEYETLYPPVDEEGYIIFDSVKVMKYEDGVEDDYVEFTDKYKFKKTTSGWGFDIVLDEDYVDDVTSLTPESKVSVSYNHSDTNEKEYRSAFYRTTRNANYSTGLANTMFVSGCSSENYTSRVWWSQVNNPMYFPDTNYVEVGSNDTAIMGLIKVGDYLGAIKQSKTTDTSIYLMYPTSFDDETTYAVKQGVQGVGALAKYSFNILGDETLFLSPNGVVAIVPSEDEEHKVQNRSFFIDGKLLKEEEISNAYSFVFDGKYWLAVSGNCYVLDGNQKNSYGNDKTNLVYEAYYLENFPATCFAKLNDELWFTNDKYLCRVKKETDLLPYNDGYGIESGETNEVVKAEWSTVLDDDGSLHYLKTMQKKGNVVSIFPAENGETSAKVYVKKDSEEPMLVGEVNGVIEEPDIPNELHIRKKFKKYKRLQFIVRNEKAEGFGLLSITKSYFLGNYAKK